jgi:hypothetical protein
MRAGAMECFQNIFTHDTREGSFVFLSSRFFAGLVNLFAEKERQCSGIGLLREIDTFKQIHVHYPATDVELSLRIISEFGMFCEPLRMHPSHTNNNVAFISLLFSRTLVFSALKIQTLNSHCSCISSSTGLEGMICHKFGPLDTIPDADALDKMIATINKEKPVWKTRGVEQLKYF